ncbi:hypothetical protein BO78DRAFT_460921 [Aspergillus sclerotiicarbonarius CBS 121057]|uniref:F-box domain-containing protein n=1 Tax=Aspergillus sclerotiicarbonarius (strain CBS 121057 / IBT 28362) TaxID=1448318 RepID=A0A319EBQ6_ASPSB|nr:hypothetical protein BO78DRAFT_460921 [Aspergillus sclerotiicarbonarius CBS 121057]
MDKFTPDIILHLGPFLTTGDYYQLVLVSKSFYYSFIPYLYYHVRIPLNDFEDTWYRRVRFNDLPVRRFTHAIIENPTLATLIHSLELYPDYCRGTWRGRSQLDGLPEEAKYRASLFPYGESKRKYWRKYYAWKTDLLDKKIHTNSPVEQAWVGLLLLQLKSLRRLSMPLQEEGRFYDHTQKLTVHFDRVIQWAANPKLGILKHLTHLSLRPAPIEQGIDGVEAIPLRRLIPFLKIPSLRYLQVREVIEHGRPTLPDHITSSLAHLRLEQIDEKLSYMPQFLSMCPRLESFSWKQFRLHSKDSEHYYLNTARFYAPLQRSRDTLRRLKFIWQDVEFPRPNFFGSVLETIHMRLSDLVLFHEGTHIPIIPLWELLPQSLKFLYIEDCLIQSSPMLCDELESLAAHLFPNCLLLQKVYIQYALQEQEPGQKCNCMPNRRFPKAVGKAEPVIEERLIALKTRFLDLGVEFRVIDRGDTVPFP